MLNIFYFQVAFVPATNIFVLEILFLTHHEYV